MTSDGKQQNQSEDFLRQAEGRSGGFLRDYLDFLRDSKRLYLLPIIILLLLVSIIVVVGATSGAPLIYTLF